MMDEKKMPRLRETVSLSDVYAMGGRPLRAEPGDRLILTKPLGTGLINTAIKAGMADGGLAEKVAQVMARRPT